MVDVLLAHSFFLKNDAKQIDKMKPYPPLGTLYAASNLRAAGYSVALFDAMFSEGMYEFEGMLDLHRPQIVALYEDQFHFLNKMCLGHSRDAACRMSQAARRRGAKVIAAGSDVSDHCAVYFEHGVQYALTGEADHSLRRLVAVLTDNSDEDLEEIPGLAIPDPAARSKTRHAPGVEPERRPDVFPLPAWDLLDVEPYRAAWMRSHGYFSLNMVSTRGCPFHCNWCAKPIWGQRYAMRSPANVVEEMLLLKSTHQPDHIWFADDIFGLRPRWVIEFAELVEKRDAAIPFMIQSRVDLMTEKAVDALSRAGCVEVWMGVESGSQRILDAMDKGTKIEQIPVVRRRLKEAGIRACYFIQLGYPGEALEDILLTVELIRDTVPDDIGVSVSYPLPGTKFHRMVQAQLGFKSHWEESNDLAMMFQGAYQTPFYRRVHDLLHRDLDVRKGLLQGGARWDRLAKEMDQLNQAWFELGRMEVLHRSVDPTAIVKDYDEVTVPDLSQDWN